jgi:sodium-dependent dicarboxylate transporter 2/3/5
MSNAGGKLRILVVDDEAPFRNSLSARLELRGYEVVQAAGGEEAVRKVRFDAGIDVVILDKNMPQMDGPATLRELKVYRPEVQVIMLTGFGSVDSALKVGRLGVYRYLSKPVPIYELTRIIDEAAREKSHARARLDMPAVRRHTRWWKRLLGSQNLRPAVILLGLVVLLSCSLMPLPSGLLSLLEAPKSGRPDTDVIAGHPGYGDMAAGQTIARQFRADYRPPGMTEENAAGHLGRRALLMIGLIITAALFWATGAVPMGITALMVAVVMYLSGIMKPDGIAQAFAKDAVVFIFGVLVFSQCIVSTGLDRRLAMLLLMPVRNLTRLLFVFLPLFALTCSFISESILIALMMPIFVTVHRELSRDPEQPATSDGHRHLLVMFALMLCYASNVGGPGSPAAGGRNAVMIGILADYGQAPTFLQWMKYGLPFVPVAALALALYFFVVFGRRLHVRRLDVAAIARRSSERLGPMNREEKMTALVSLLVVGLWIFASDRLGMGGPVLLGLVLLNLLGVMKWRQITRIHWDVVFLYAGASALGKGLAETGGALYLARGFVGALPESWLQGGPEAFAGGAVLPMAVSLLTGLVTNIMSDGATVAAVGPIAVPMARDAGLHPWMMGFATAFASSFPHMLIIGTPANALVYILCKDPRTGRQLVTQKDFLKHGFFAFVLSFAVLWGWAFLGYWRWFGFQAGG